MMMLIIVKIHMACDFSYFYFGIGNTAVVNRYKGFVFVFSGESSTS